MRRSIRGSFQSFLRLGLLSVLFLAACDTSDTPTGVESDPVGDWQATLTRADSSGTPVDARYVLELGSDNKSVYEMFRNGIYFTGFEGGWALKGDNVELTAIRCYKGDRSGVQTVVECGESMAIPTRDVRWDGRNITILREGATLVFQKIVNAMAAKAE